MKTKMDSANRSSRRLGIESLESRQLLVTFGTPWPDARSLSVSFPTDQAAIGAFENNLRQSLDQVEDRKVWQEAVLRAFQTWAVNANINIGLVPDRGDDFGAVGLASNDPRYGEFRIGAFPQTGVLANALPFQQQAGTWSGDVLVNTNVSYFLAPPNSTSPISIPTAPDGSSKVELGSVLLHEAGNALGLADNNTAGAVMNGNYSGPNLKLKSSDISAIRKLYGARKDIYETVSNNSRTSATRINHPAGYDGTTPLSINGSLNTMVDVDFYRFQPLAGEEKVTVRLWGAGISLLKAKLEVLDQFGKKISDAKVDSIFENNLQLEIGSLSPNSPIFIRVARNADDVFGIGDYKLELDYRDPSQQPSIVPPIYDQDAHEDDDDEPVNYVSVDALFAKAGILEKEVGANDTLATAKPLETTIGFLANTRYEVQASIASLGDRDLWSFVAPMIPTSKLQVSVDAVGLNPTKLEVYLLNSAGDRIGVNVVARPDGGVTFEVANPVPGERYVLFVRTALSETAPAGNYVASVSFATNVADNMRQVLSGSIATGAMRVMEFETYKTQLLQFELSASSDSANLGVQMTLYDARTGDIVANFGAASGKTSREYLWLGKGKYYWRIEQVAKVASQQGTVQYSLKADVLSDDQGPRIIDPNQNANPYPDWETRLPPTPTVPVIQIVEPPFTNPWTSQFQMPSIYNFYQDNLV